MYVDRAQLACNPHIYFPAPWLNYKFLKKNMWQAFVLLGDKGSDAEEAPELSEAWDSR